MRHHVVQVRSLQEGERPNCRHGSANNGNRCIKLQRFTDAICPYVDMFDTFRYQHYFFLPFVWFLGLNCDARNTHDRFTLSIGKSIAASESLRVAAGDLDVGITDVSAKLAKRSHSS